LINELLTSKQGTKLRKNGSEVLKITIDQNEIMNIFLINGNRFKTENLSQSDLTIKPNSFYMIINNGKNTIELSYNENISSHEIIYDPYKYTTTEKITFKPDDFKQIYSVPEGYIDTLPKWYSFKFTYDGFSLIFVKPEMGLSFQIHKKRSESWEILKGKPIIVSGNQVHYYVGSGGMFENSVNSYHTVINPNRDKYKFVLIKEKWSGSFDEDDIIRVFNPNKYG
jgi:mannose-6-phosphate isomerase-like protein (cupin superfamily)